jgi:AcrR family transcriptional regulator
MAKALSVDRVVAAAVDAVRRDGVDAFTMRRLAGELGVTPMAIYHHVPGKDELLARVGDRILGELDASVVEGQPWDAAVGALATGLRARLRMYPGVARYLLASGPGLPGAAQLAALTVRQLQHAGFTIPEATRVVTVVFGYVLARCHIEDEIDLSYAVPSTVESEIATGYAAFDVDEQFAYGLDCLLAGVAAQRKNGRRR